jgi:hypothetical protein
MTFILLVLPSISLYFAISTISPISVIIVDMYLISVLVFAAWRSDNRTIDPPEWMKQFFPSRLFGLIVVFGLVFAVILCFANFYIQLGYEFKPNICSITDAIYFSVVTLTTVGYGDFAPTCVHAKLLVMFDLFNTTLLLLGMFPLLIGRLSSFRDY